uniref:Alkaline phosphatase n=1 Tax=Romanomermis culicivorax TaxID=13658 RepID=A0A915JW33_ROMCU
YFRKHAADKILKSETGYNKPQSTKAKNVILFIGDGMGSTVITAGRIYKSQKESGNSVSNEDYQKPFSFENMPHAAMVKTHSYSGHVTDSAAAATAMLCGAKVPTDSVGVHWNSFDASGDSNRAYSLLNCIGKYALDSGKKVGVVTTTRLSHATPASLYAHHPDRRRESGAYEDKRNSQSGQVIFKDIAEQLVADQPAANFTVLLGGGLSGFKPCSPTQPKLTFEETAKIAESITCRFDDRNLVDQWLNASKKRAFVRNKRELFSVDDSNNEQVLGLFSNGHLPYVLDRNKETLEQPTLVEMTKFSIEFLRKKSPNGYFLLIEGGAIDLALHVNKAKRSFEELIEFDNALAQAMTMVDLEETLVIVTADHSHNLNLKGYASKAVPILSYLPAPDRNPILSKQQNWTMLTFADGPSGARNQLDSSTDNSDIGN